MFPNPSPSLILALSLAALPACTPSAAPPAASLATHRAAEDGVGAALADALVFAGPATIDLETPVVVGLLGREGIPHHDARFHDHYQEAAILLEDGDHAGAIDALRLAIFDAPESAVSWFALGESYVGAGRRAQGVACIEEAVRHQPAHAEARRFLARHWLDRDAPETARPHADKLASIARDDFRSHYLRSRVFSGLSMWEESIGAGRRAITLNPQFVYAYNNVGFAALQLGRDVLAVQYLEAAVELEPVEPYMLNNLGVAYERLDRHGDALAAYARSASLDPAYVKAVANRDRMQITVDREVADEVARILAARRGLQEPTEAVASGILSP